MATKFEDFIQKVVRKLRGEDQEAELVVDYVSLSVVLKIYMVKTFMLKKNAVPFMLFYIYNFLKMTVLRL